MMLPSRLYESEHTKFMRELMRQHPELPDKQREARAIWWDKTPRELADEGISFGQSPWLPPSDS